MLEDYGIIASGGGIYSAEVTVQNDKQESATFSAKNDLEHPNIDGPIAALYSALNEATGTDYPLQSYRVDAIGSGKQTIGKATVVLRVNGRTVTGYGVSLDTYKAAGLAYLDAIKQASEKKRV